MCLQTTPRGSQKASADPSTMPGTKRQRTGALLGRSATVEILLPRGDFKQVGIFKQVVPVAESTVPKRKVSVPETPKTHILNG